VSPDERSVAHILDRAAFRARAIAIAEAVAWGAAVAAMSDVAGIAVAAAIAAWRLRGTTPQSVVRAVERAHGEVRNLLVTASELSSGGLAAKSHVRQRVFAHAAAVSQRIDVSAAFPIRPVARALVVAMAAWLVVSTAQVWRRALTRPVPGLVPPVESPGPAAAPRPLHVAVTLEPPAYTGRAATTAVDPRQIDALEHTVMTMVVDAQASRVTADHDGAIAVLSRDASGRFVGRVELTRTGFISIVADRGGERLIPVVVSPDALPAVRVTVPNRDLVFADAEQRVAFEVHATDDFGLRSLSLQYTKVSGSGEQFEFQEGEIPLEIVRANGRDWRGKAARMLAALHLKDGDMLVYRALAADARSGDGIASSDAFFIEISKLGVEAGDAFTVPEEETRYALSQQMLIIKTERLHEKRSTMPPVAFREEALNLAVEQRMVRAEFVFMLGGEVEDEEVEASHSTELQEGRLANRGQRDLRAATIAMSQAEKLLTGADTAGALTAERAAVTALQRAFTRDRYILRALATRTELDPQRRLTGNLSQAVNWRRQPPAARSNRRAALLQDLLAGFGALRSPADSRPARAIELGREALSIDADSAVLRAAAAELQRVADTWSTTDIDSRRNAIEGVAGAVAAEAARALATAPISPSRTAPPLAGAFADALRRGSAR
jgi:hypothetical protein